MEKEEMKKLEAEFKKMMDSDPKIMLAVIANPPKQGDGANPVLFLADPNGNYENLVTILLTACKNCTEIKDAVLQTARIVAIEHLTSNNKTIN